MLNPNKVMKYEYTENVFTDTKVREVKLCIPENESVEEYEKAMDEVTEACLRDFDTESD